MSLLDNLAHLLQGHQQGSVPMPGAGDFYAGDPLQGGYDEDGATLNQMPTFQGNLRRR